MDDKYGRLYTHQDMLEIVKVIYEGARAGKDLEDIPVRMTDLTFPDNEPLFLLRAKDRRALGALLHYRDHQSPTASLEHVDGIAKAIRNFDDFRMSHAELMKDPD